MELRTKKKLKFFDGMENSMDDNNTIFFNNLDNFRYDPERDNEESKEMELDEDVVLKDKEDHTRRILKFFEQNRLKRFDFFFYFSQFIGKKSYFYLLGISSLCMSLCISYYINMTNLLLEFEYTNVQKKFTKKNFIKKFFLKNNN